MLFFLNVIKRAFSQEAVPSENNPKGNLKGKSKKSHI